MEKFIDKKNLKEHGMIPGFKARFIHSKTMTISYWDIIKGSQLPEHSHPHEQISQVLEGEFQLTVNGESMIMTPGKIAVIPSGATHSGKAITNCQVMDIFSPPREDYMLT